MRQQAALLSFALAGLLNLVGASSIVDVHAGTTHLLMGRARVSTLTCKNGFVLNSAKTACYCPQSKLKSLDKQKCLTYCSAGSFDDGGRDCKACTAGEGVARCSSATVAVACKDGWFLSGQSCVKSCPAGTWGDSAPTKNRCRTCTDKNAAECKDGGKGSATSCRTGYLYQGTCLDEQSVPEGFYGNEATHTAEPCAEFVKTCSGPGPRDALSCGKNKKNDQYFLTSYGDCRLHCQKGWYGVKKDGLCYPCDATMETCDAGGAILCAKSASEPTGRLVKTPDRRCVPSGSELDGYYLDSGSGDYKPCDDGVKTCTGSGEGNALSCGLSASGEQYFMHTYRQLSQARRKRRLRPSPSTEFRGMYSYNECIPGDACEDGTYPNATTATCDPCFTLAATCDAHGRNTTCLDEMWSLGTDAGLFCVADRDCGTLGPYYASQDVYECKPCADGVTACTGPSLNEARECATSSEGAFLYYHQDNHSCVTTCPDGTIPNDEWHNCDYCGYPDRIATCSAENVATNCKDGYYLHDDQCYASYECAGFGAFYPDDDTHTCAPCRDGVDSCQGIGAGLEQECGTAKNGTRTYMRTTRSISQSTKRSAYSYQVLVNYESECVIAEDCSAGTFADPAGVCAACDPRFGTCDAVGDFTCGHGDYGIQPFYLRAGQCLTSEECQSLGTEWMPNDETHECVPVEQDPPVLEVN